MFQFPRPPREAQIRAILSDSQIGYDNWVEQYLPRFDRSSVQFDEVFDVSAYEVFRYVVDNGWDARLVKHADVLPNLNNPESMFYKYLILPPSNGHCYLAHFGNYDRELWLKWEFDDQETMMHWLIEELFKAQKKFWELV